MKSWKGWLLLGMCVTCVAAAMSAPDWVDSQRDNGYGYHPPHPPHPTHP
jgi:hypothetical protein